MSSSSRADPRLGADRVHRFDKPEAASFQLVLQNDRVNTAPRSEPTFDELHPVPTSLRQMCATFEIPG